VPSRCDAPRARNAKFDLLRRLPERQKHSYGRALMDDDGIWIEFRGKRIVESNYGRDYPQDFRYILTKYAPSETGNILEWGSGLTTLIVQSMLDEIGARLFTSIENDKDFFRVCRNESPTVGSACYCES
jgi:hypothetical protein